MFKSTCIIIELRRSSMNLSKVKVEAKYNSKLNFFVIAKNLNGETDINVVSKSLVPKLCIR